jgi:photosystem II stability/assembly factor-like uncharacterized protein
MGAYMKFRYGKWINDIPEVIASGTYVLNPLTLPTHNCYRIESPYSPGEYFVVEYRKKSNAFENSLPGSGLLVYRINTERTSGNTDGPPDEVYIYRPNGTLSSNGNIEEAHYSAGVNRMVINDTTNPSSFLSSGSPGGLNIDDVGNADSTISFKVKIGTDSDSTFWRQTNGLDGSHKVPPIKALTFNTKGHIFAGTTRGAVFRSTNNGVSWNWANLRWYPMSVYALISSANGHAIVGASDGVYLFPDDNVSRPFMLMYVIDVTSFARNSSGHVFAGTSSNGTFRATDTDNGYYWNWKSIGLSGYYVSTLAINASGHIFAGTSSGVFRSTNNGDSWILVNNDSLNSFFNSFVFNLNGHIFAGNLRAGVSRSTDDGITWTQVNNGLTNTLVWSLVINSSGHIFAGTDGGGVFRSTNNGDSWMRVNTGLEDSVVYALALSPKGYLFAATYGASGGRLFRTVRSTTTSVNDISSVLPPIFSLEQNYPNPFNSTTSFEFQVSRFGFVNLKVYDVLGREVATVVSENLFPGRHKIEWNAHNLASGVYFYRLETNRVVKTKKLVLLR